MQESQIILASAELNLEVSGNGGVALEHGVQVVLADFLLHAALYKGSVLAVASASSELDVQDVLRCFFAERFFGGRRTSHFNCYYTRFVSL